MAFTVLTSPDDIRPVLDRFVAADPVRATLLGTIGQSLGGGAWAAVDGEVLAVRSETEYPVVIEGPWTDAARAALLGLLAGVPDVRGFSGPVELVRPLLGWLGPEVKQIEQRLFRCQDLVPAAGVAGTAMIADDSHRRLARAWVAAFVAELDDFAQNSDPIADRALDGGGLFLWVDDGEPVSMAARRPVVSGSARVGPVYTPPDRRGHGYGSAVMSAATRSILDEGATPVLFTDLDNPTSNKIYQLLGYEPVEDRLIGTRG